MSIATVFITYSELDDLPMERFMQVMLVHNDVIMVRVDKPYIESHKEYFYDNLDQGIYKILRSVFCIVNTKKIDIKQEISNLQLVAPEAFNLHIAAQVHFNVSAVSNERLT